MAVNRAPGLSDLVLVAAAATVASALVLLDGQGWPEWVFGTFMLSALALLGRLGLESWRSARAERQRAECLGATQPSVVAEHAVALERARLNGEVEECIRDALRQVAVEINDLDEKSPVPGLQRVHALTRRTASELRRQLGLLRESADEQVAPASGGSPADRRASRRRAVAEGLVLACVAAVETTLFLTTAGPRDRLPWSVLVTMLAAGTIAGRGSRPVTAVLAFAGLVTAGSIVGYPISSGFWIVITLGVLVWTLAADPVSRLSSVLARAATACCWSGC